MPSVEETKTTNCGQNKQFRKQQQCPQILNRTPKTTTGKTTIKLTQNIELSTRPARLVAKRTTPQRDDIFDPMQQIGRLAGTEHRNDRVKLNKLTKENFRAAALS